MSETLELPTTTETPAQTEPPATGAETPATTEAIAEQQAEAKRQSQKDRRFAHLTAKAADAQRARDQAIAERDAMKALLEAQGAGKEVPTIVPPTTADAVRAEAQRLRAQEKADEARVSLIQNGVKELGEAVWNEKTAILHDFGATANPAFMAAITELPESHKIVAALADDVDQLETLLKKSPAAMAAHLGRMSAQLESPKKAAISGAPKPVSPVGGNAVAEVDPEKMSMREYVAWRAKHAPRHLGGQGKAR